VATGISTGSGGGAWPAEGLHYYQSRLGVSHTPALYNWFEDFGSTGSYNEFDPTPFDQADDRNMTPMVSLHSHTAPLQSIAAGDHDAYLHRWANAARDWTISRDKDILLRFAHEMNGEFHPWSVGVNGNTAEDYVAAWKRVHGILRQESAMQVKLVWSPIEHTPHDSATFEEVYPGGEYVDWVAVDTYNWGSVKSHDFDSDWRSMRHMIGPSDTRAGLEGEYDELVAFGKPIMIAETGTHDAPGDKAAWIAQTYGEDIPQEFPEVKAVVYFDINADGANWQLDLPPATREAYVRHVANNGYYSGELPK
jgi:hypothetical protein